MATGWAKDGAVQDQIDDTIKDAVTRARANLRPQPPGTPQGQERPLRAAPVPEGVPAPSGRHSTLPPTSEEGGNCRALSWRPGGSARTTRALPQPPSTFCR